MTDENESQNSVSACTAGTPPIIPELVTALFGIVATSLIASPLVFLFAFGNYFVAAPLLTYIVMYLSSYTGIYVSLAASALNAAIVSLLARRGYDAPQISVLSGAIIGAAIPIIAPLREPASPGALAVEMAARQPAGFLGCVITGALMGLVYWVIAVWWQRQKRLAQETTELRARTATSVAKRDRRIPWDGRVPRD